MPSSIAQASVFITEVIDVLEDLYWESPGITVKNQCFNAIRFLQNELTELTKVSVQDHHYDYEIISCPAKDMEHCLKNLTELIEKETLRTQTRIHLMPLLNKAQTFFS